MCLKVILGSHHNKKRCLTDWRSFFCLLSPRNPFFHELVTSHKRAIQPLVVMECAKRVGVLQYRNEWLLPRPPGVPVIAGSLGPGPPIFFPQGQGLQQNIVIDVAGWHAEPSPCGYWSSSEPFINAIDRLRKRPPVLWSWPPLTLVIRMMSVELSSEVCIHVELPI